MLENGQYEIMGLMHVYTEEPGGEKHEAIARENMVEVTVTNLTVPDLKKRS